MATIKEIAEKTGYAQATISRVLNADRSLSITPNARMRILSAAEEIGYAPKKAREAVSGDWSIALLSYSSTFKNEIDSGYYFSIRSGIQTRCDALGIKYTFITLAELKKYPRDYDGIIVIGHLHKADYDEILKYFKTRSIVAVNTVYYYPELISHVSFDNRLCAEIAMDYILSNHHTKIGYIGHREFEDIERFGSRLQTFTSSLEKRGLLNPKWILECDRGVEEAYQATKEWLGRLDELPTAFFCANDPVAIGALKAFYRHGLDVPKDISIVSVDGTFITKFSNPPISSVDVHTFEMGQESVHLLVEQMAGRRSIVSRLILMPTLIERDSLRRLDPQE
jgi:LacI family transcriptional regulator